jgi:hypothetical protein
VLCDKHGVQQMTAEYGNCCGRAAPRRPITQGTTQ